MRMTAGETTSYPPWETKSSAGGRKQPIVGLLPHFPVGKGEALCFNSGSHEYR